MLPTATPSDNASSSTSSNTPLGGGGSSKWSLPWKPAPPYGRQHLRAVLRVLRSDLGAEAKLRALKTGHDLWRRGLPPPPVTPPEIHLSPDMEHSAEGVSSSPPPPPKSPTTVQEWVNSLDITRPSGEETKMAATLSPPSPTLKPSSHDGERTTPEDTFHLGAEAHSLMENSKGRPRTKFSKCKQSSFNSDVSILSSISSVESLLESRREDPEEILLSLGFGGRESNVSDMLSRVPQRFLMSPSCARGVDVDQFLSLAASPRSSLSTLVSTLVASNAFRSGHLRQSTDSILDPANREFLSRQGSEPQPEGVRRLVLGRSTYRLNPEGLLINTPDVRPGGTCFTFPTTEDPRRSPLLLRRQSRIEEDVTPPEVNTNHQDSCPEPKRLLIPSSSQRRHSIGGCLDERRSFPASPNPAAAWQPRDHQDHIWAEVSALHASLRSWREEELRLKSAVASWPRLLETQLSPEQCDALHAASHLRSGLARTFSGLQQLVVHGVSLSQGDQLPPYLSLIKKMFELEKDQSKLCSQLEDVILNKSHENS